ncbi:aminoglycoside phosphotransferase family protein [Elioraea thermophila]|uniref:aminoglycoside phosphotransferase family protein n=1 Tax=Elioraea thermophila TaxID=2185104 RepID=UPI001300993E|nr:aminoglycoside phosphotransferase family protein [Elioraea thermophila]
MKREEPPRSRPGPQEWRAALPTRAGAIAREWGLALGAPLGCSTQGLVRAASLAENGTPAVLKLEKPGQGVAAQAAALAAWAGRGAVRLLRADPDRGALLLERLAPGTPLAALCPAGRDDEATVTVAEVSLALRRPPPEGAVLADAHGWWRAIAACRDPRLEAQFRDRALGLWRELAASAPAPSLIHGDLHHGNILADGEAWRAIDPIGATGDPLFDPASALCEPVSFLARLDHLPRLLDRRLGRLAERLAADRARLAAWAFAIAVLKTVWAIEDGRNERGYAAIAAVLSPSTS